MNKHVKEALFFSENHTLQIQKNPLDQLIHRVIDLAETKLKRHFVEVILKGVEPLDVEMDHVLIQRLLGNILSNAIDASSDGAKIMIELRRVGDPERKKEWARIRISDEGTGISPENMTRITAGYFTTKDAGDENRGFGLGLAICRKIVHLHGGNLNISSEEKKGTNVQVDLPIQHEKKQPNGDSVNAEAAA